MASTEEWVRKDDVGTFRRWQDDVQEKRNIIYDRAILLHLLRCWSKGGEPSKIWSAQ